MLIKNKNRRITLSEALNHKWFDSEIKKIDSIDTMLSEDLVNNMRLYRKNTKLKKISMNVFFKMLPSHEKEG